jgi:hypothetical protein
METAQTAPASSASMGRKRRRTIPIIDARFQWKYTLIITAIGVGVTSIMGGFLYNAHVDNTRLLDLDGNTLLQEKVMRGDQIFLLYLVVLVLVMAVALAFWGLIVTHRISGPLFILERYLGILADGRYPDLRPLRKRDELQEFFTAFEEAVATLRTRDEGVVKELDAAVAQAKKALAGDSKRGLEEAIAALERQKATLAEFLVER